MRVFSALALSFSGTQMVDGGILTSTSSTRTSVGVTLMSAGGTQMVDDCTLADDGSIRMVDSSALMSAGGTQTVDNDSSILTSTGGTLTTDGSILMVGDGSILDGRRRHPDGR
jgi:hypothetical protein